MIGAWAWQQSWCTIDDVRLIVKPMTGLECELTFHDLPLFDDLRAVGIIGVEFGIVWNRRVAAEGLAR